MVRKLGCTLLGLCIAWLAGCNKPCQTTSECGDGDVCAAAICQAVSCETSIFAVDPKSGACVALSGCFLTEEQRSWVTCSEDPCASLSETSCLADERCQPSYRFDDVPTPKKSSSGDEPTTAFACRGGDVVGVPAPGPDGKVVTPGVHTGDDPKHPWNSGSTFCGPTGSVKSFAGCRAVPQITPQKPCTRLTKEECATRRDCRDLTQSGSKEDIAIAPVPPGVDFGLGVCGDRNPLSTSCEGAGQMSCLLNAECQAVGTSCFCPVGTSCTCDGGAFTACERNDRLRRCASSSDCRADERCDNDEACIAPRTYQSALPGAAPLPGSPSCLGACVPKGCAGLGENRCNADARCDAGTYGTVCHPQPYCTGGGLIINDVGATDMSSPDDFANSCGCATEFKACSEPTPINEIVAERSLLVRDPEIIDDATFRVDNVLAKLAPAGQVDAFARSLLQEVGVSRQLGNLAVAEKREGFATYLTELRPTDVGLTQRLASEFHTTGLVNRLDLATVGNCGEARITFALNRAYTNGNERMTMIVELKVPDDKMGCKQVAQRWAELSAVESLADRRQKLVALYTELLKPENLGQLRTNEFINRRGTEAWQLRELHIAASGMLELVPAAQTVDRAMGSSPDLLTWARQNAAALKAGTALVPARFLAAASSENGGRVKLAGSATDTSLQEIEGSINQLACAGCHLTETRSPFTHIGERLAKTVAGRHVPSGRAVIDEFMQKELPKRAKFLRSVLFGGLGLVAGDFRPEVLTRVH